MGRAALAVFLLVAAGCGRAAFEAAAPNGTGPTPTPSPSAVPTPTVLVLIAESFSAGSAGLQAPGAVTWTDSSGGGFEVYTTSGAGARGMKSTYDADQNAGTAQVSIPGGLEVNDDQSNVLLIASFRLSPLIGQDTYSGGELWLWMGNRGAPAGTQYVEVFDVTTNGSLTGHLTATLPTGGTPRDWSFNSWPIPFTSAAAGHVIELRFQSTGNSGEGFELADVHLTANLN